jgi:uncharacterized protein YggU (UPF0235/DUF167 family)
MRIQGTVRAAATEGEANAALVALLAIPPAFRRAIYRFSPARRRASSG